MAEKMDASGEVIAWDVPTRVFHWALVFCIASSWVSLRYAEALGDPTMKWHRYNGYAIIVLMLFRIVWGFVGGPTSRWRNFLAPPGAALRYLGDMMRGTSTHYLGHNPLGAYMILALLAVVALQCGIGLLLVEHNETTWGPLYKLVPESWQKPLGFLHHALFYFALLPLIVTHILANVGYSFLKKDPLIRAMVTGRKPPGQYAGVGFSHPARSGIGFGLAVLLTAALAAAGMILALGGRLFY